jgi:glycosyltransferase involved in cell wall biosynthesis
MLEDKAKALADRVRFLGPRDDIPDLMCAADAFVFPSRWEGLGSVLLEAMALETPIIATDLPAIREVLDGDACGELVPPDHPEALAEAIVRTLNSDGARSKVRLARHRFEEEYTAARIAQRMAAFYERALGRRVRATA